MKIHGIEARKGTRATAYRVSWTLNEKRFRETFRTNTLADSFRSELVTAARKGEPFNVSNGLPESMRREANPPTEPMLTLFEKYTDFKWEDAAAKSRSGLADALATAALALVTDASGRPEPRLIRRVVAGWVCNTKKRSSPMSDDVARAHTWLSSNMLPVTALDDSAVLRQVLEQFRRKLDGKSAAAKTVLRKRATFYNFLEYAVDEKAITENRLPQVKWKAPLVSRAIDKRALAVNPQQGERLLNAVAAQRVEGQPRRSSGPMLRGYFATMYYAALRPEEAAQLRKADLDLPDEGWGELLISSAAPIAGAAWTDSGNRRDKRQLKQRAVGEVRPVPCSPPLTRILREHIDTLGVATDGRLFRNLDGGDLAESTISRCWDNARKAALTPEEYASPMAKRPYDLRHACVSFWLAVGVPAAQVAKWAGHSITVLLEVYATVIAGLHNTALRQIDQGLAAFEQGSGQRLAPQNLGPYWDQTPENDRSELDSAGHDRIN